MDTGELVVGRYQGRVLASVAEIESRLEALDVERADYHAVIAAINASGENQRELASRIGTVETCVRALDTGLGEGEQKVDDTGVWVRSIEEGVAEVEDLLLRARPLNQR